MPNLDPVFVKTPVVGSAMIGASATNTATDGTGSLVTLINGTASGVVIHRIDVVATGTTYAGLLRFFVKTPSRTNPYLILEIPIPALTVSSVIPAWRTEITPDPVIVLPDNCDLRAAKNVATAGDINIIVWGGDLTD